MAHEEDRRAEVDKRYASVKKQIMNAILRSSTDPFFRSSLEDLQKTLSSMEPMVKDIHGHVIMTNRFLELLEQVVLRIHQFLEIERPAALSKVGNLTASICLWLGIELPASSMFAISFKKDLEIIRERLKDLYADYVKEELDKLALSNPVTDQEVTEGLLRYLLSNIRNEALRPSSNPVFERIQIILESLETGFYNSKQEKSSESSAGGSDNFSQPPIDMPRLLRLLKEVELLLRFLNGDHGLDILYSLRQRDYALRGFVPDAVKSWLRKMDWRHAKLWTDKEREKEMIFLLLFLVFGVLRFAKELDNPEYPKYPSEFANITIFAIFILIAAYFLVSKVSTHWRLGQSHAKRESSNASNSCCGGFQLKILAAVMVAVVAIAMAVPDDPKKYDIFLNFRGSPEIRYTVVGVLHTGLENANISTFFDERNSRKTKKFRDEIESAISTSVGAITIFSEHYGESDYCLDELLLLLERQKTNKGYMIWPIFYDVEPDDLTNPESKFGQGLQKHYMTQQKDVVEEWKEGLRKLIEITGNVHKSSHQHLDKLVHEVVEHFKNELGNKRSTKDSTIQRLQSLIMKLPGPFCLQVGPVKVEKDLKKGWQVTVS